MQNFNLETAGFMEQIKKISNLVVVGMLFFFFAPRGSRAAGENTPPPSTTEFIISPSQVLQRGEPKNETEGMQERHSQ